MVKVIKSDDTIEELLHLKDVLFQRDTEIENLKHNRKVALHSAIQMQGEIAELKATLKGIAALLETYTNLHPAFRSMPVGAPNSQARDEQNAEIDLEDKAKAAIAKVRP